MLLPILLLLASAGPAQQAINAAPTRQFSFTEQNHTRQFFVTNQNRHALVGTYRIFSEPVQNRFVNPGPRGKRSFDKGIVAGRSPCLADGTCQAVCAHITAYVFSDGENPRLQYVTDCPNLDVPYRSERANHNGTDTEHQSGLKRMKN